MTLLVKLFSVVLICPFYKNLVLLSGPQVIEARQKESPYLLPEAVFVDCPKYALSNSNTVQLFRYWLIILVYLSVCRLPSSLEKVEGEVLFLQSKITEVLGGSGYNTERLATPYIPQFTGNNLEPFQVTDNTSTSLSAKIIRLFTFQTFFHPGCDWCSHV